MLFRVFPASMPAVYLVVACLFPGAQRAAQAELSPPFYRHYQFLEYTGQPSPVIGNILKDQKLGRLDNKPVAIQLTLARLYISLGLHFQAGKILQSLVKQKLDGELAKEIWFYLARSYYHMGYMQQAEDALNRVSPSVQSPTIRAEKQHLQALILMSRNEYRQAAELMQKNWWQAPGNWDLYARFNLAVALIRSDREQQGLDLLKQTVLIPPDDNEAASLIDKFNQTMGYVLLQQQRAQDARPYLEAVRLHGPYSNMALLGAGWASTLLKQYRQALVPWLELHGRDIREVSVQEVMLAVPYAYEQLQAWGQAADYYRQAVSGFQAEIGRIQQSIEALNRQALGDALERVDVKSETAWLASIQKLDGHPATRYLQQFLDDEVFFNALNNYREARSILLQADRQFKKINQLASIKFDQLGAGGSNPDNREQIDAMQAMAADLFKRVNQLRLQAKAEIDGHTDHLQRRSKELLIQRKSRLDVYLVQARLALAQIYDRQGQQP